MELGFCNLSKKHKFIKFQKSYPADQEIEQTDKIIQTFKRKK